MAKTNIARAEELRKAGKTYEEIAEEIGVTKQAVHQALKSKGRLRRRYESIFEECPYIGLRNFLLENKYVKISGLSQNIFGHSEPKAMAKVNRLLRGDDVQMSVRNIRSLEKFTGMTFDKLFEVEDDS